MAADDVRIQREAREAKEIEIALTLPCADYYASGRNLRRSDDASFVMQLSSHTEACDVMMAAMQHRYA